MNKRIVGTILWALVGSGLGSILTIYVGLPSGLNIAVAILTGVFVWFDPAHWLWPVETGTRKSVRRPVPRPEPSVGGLSTQD